MSWCWEGDTRWLVAVNLGDESAAAMVRAPWDDLAGHQVRLVDPTNDVTYDRSGDDIVAGLYVELAPWGWHLFRVETEGVSMSPGKKHDTAEHRRLAEATGRAEDDLFNANPWYEWGPYLSERAWGTVREDYSEDGDAWSSFPHDHARSRAYRWNEDGMAGLSDIRHELCLGLSLWNGADPILKERMFGLTGPAGQPR